MFKLILELLDESAAKGYGTASELRMKLETGVLPIRNLTLEDLVRFDKETAELATTYVNTVVGYKFRFLITENNNNSAKATFSIPFTNGNFTLGVGAGKELQRETTRQFTITDSFPELLKLECEGIFVNQKNLLYPLIGNVGIDEVINTFIRLNIERGFDATIDNFW